MLLTSYLQIFFNATAVERKRASSCIKSIKIDSLKANFTKLRLINGPLKKYLDFNKAVSYYLGQSETEENFFCFK